MLDASYSITEDRFNKDIKRFLIDLIKSRKLNVGKDGTRLALIIFSEDTSSKTKIMFGFGKKSADTYIQSIKHLDYSYESGEDTATGTAMRLANEKVGNRRSLWFFLVADPCFNSQ